MTSRAKTRRLKPAPGNILEIVLPGDRRVFAHYLLDDVREGIGYGAVIQVYEIPAGVEPHTFDPSRGRPLFGPIFAGVQKPVKTGRWRVVGTVPVRVTFPLRFRQTSATKPGIYDDWKIVTLHEDGRVRKEIVGLLAEQDRALEMFVVWGDELLERRIATGKSIYDSIF